jgi:hypothetical protein
VTLYIVEHRLKDVGEGHLAALRGALAEITQRLNVGDDGESIRYVRSTVVAAEDRCICLFDATSEQLVRRANELAQVPIASIAQAVDYPMEEAPGSA